MTDTLGDPVGGHSRALPQPPQWLQSFTIRAAERWYAVNTLAHRETGAKLQLQAQGFRAFSPYIMRTVRHARKLRTVRVPIFPGYIFVILDVGRDRWRSVNGTFGVASLVMGGDQPQPVPLGVVEALLVLSDDTSLLRRDHDLQLGQMVRVVAGPFASILGRLDRLDDNGRVRVLLEIMGGQVPTLLDRSSLEPVS